MDGVKVLMYFRFLVPFNKEYRIVFKLFMRENVHEEATSYFYYFVYSELMLKRDLQNVYNNYSLFIAII